MTICPHVIIATMRRRGLPEAVIARKLGLRDGETGYGVTRLDAQTPVTVIPDRSKPIPKPKPVSVVVPILEPEVPGLYRTRDVVLREVGNAWEVSPDDLLTKRKAQRLAMPRQAVYLLMRRYSRLSLPAIARALGQGDHSGIVRGCRRARELYEHNRDWRRRFDEAEARLKES